MFIFACTLFVLQVSKMFIYICRSTKYTGSSQVSHIKQVTLSSEFGFLLTCVQVGKGFAYYMGFMPSLSYFDPAIPLRPVDRSSVDEGMDHFIPTEFDTSARDLLTIPLIGKMEDPDVVPVFASNALVRSTDYRAPMIVHSRPCLCCMHAFTFESPCTMQGQLYFTSIAPCRIRGQQTTATAAMLSPSLLLPLQLQLFVSIWVLFELLFLLLMSVL
jgi:hypothetical protein